LVVQGDTPQCQEDMEANRPFQNIVLADGVPHHGHISHASYRWWTEFFLSGGWTRHRDLEAAMMNFARATFMEHRSNPYVLEQLDPAANSIEPASTNRIGPGWHDIESLEGRPGRWTHGNAQLYFAAGQQGPCAVELELAAPHVNVIRDWYVLLSVERLVRPTPWSFEWMPLAVSAPTPLHPRGKRTVLDVSLLAAPQPVRKDMILTDVCRLNIISPHYVPRDYHLSEDHRPLGVMVHRVRIRHGAVRNCYRKGLMNITPVLKNAASALRGAMTRIRYFSGGRPGPRSSRAPGGGVLADDHFLLDLFPLRPDLPLPGGMNEDTMFAFLNSIRVENGPEEELAGYCRADWKRFLYTWGLVRDLSGTCLELGANPYFTTGLLREFTRLELSLANYFGPQFSAEAEQKVRMVRRGSSEAAWVTLPFRHFNIEAEPFPFPDRHFDVVLFCEIIEHLLTDPIKVLTEIKRVLKPGGTLVLTTPNVARLENVARMMGGANIYDPYSGYGPYGRHNREYNRHELGLLLAWCGLEVEAAFTADVHANHALDSISRETMLSLSKALQPRQGDLGQYLFLRARSSGPIKPKRPAWLYRSYPAGEIETC
jgi:SAM-dependent methyltransferase